MISGDNKILEEGSMAQVRMASYGEVCDELHILVPTIIGERKKTEITGNVFAYSVTASNKIFSLLKTYHMGISIISQNSKFKTENWLVTSQDPFFLGFCAWRIAEKIGAKLELQIHTDFLSSYFSKESLFNKIRVILAKFLLPKADGIRAVSKRISDSLIAESLVLKAVPVVLPIFVDVENIKNILPSVDLHKKYPQFDFIVLMASRLSREKNIGLAIEVMSKVVKNHSKAGLIIVGSGPEREGLELKAKSYKLTANVVFENWTNDVISYMKTADVFLSTSNYEGFGLTLAEAASSSCPIISTDVGLVGDILKDKVSLLVCPVGGSSCIAQKIINLMNSPEEGKRIALSASESVVNLFSGVRPNVSFLALFK